MSVERYKSIFGEQLRKYMEMQSVEIAELADATGVDTSTVYAWLRGDRLPDMKHLTKAAEVLRLELPQLLSQPDDDPYARGHTAARDRIIEMIANMATPKGEEEPTLPKGPPGDNGGEEKTA